MPECVISSTGRLRRFLLPDWGTRKRLLRREAWFLVIASYPILAFALLWPPAFRNANTARVLVAWAALLVRTFFFHAGLVYAVIAIIAAFSRNRRLLLATCPLVLITLGPVAIQYRPRTPPPARGERITVMSANLLMINTNTGPSSRRPGSRGKLEASTGTCV